MTDAEKKRAFIEARRGSSGTSASSATPTPRTTPRSSSATNSPANTRQRVPAQSATSREKARRTAKPKVAPRKPTQARPSSTPRRSSSSSSRTTARSRATPTPAPTAQRQQSRPRRAYRPPRSPHGGPGGRVAASVVISRTDEVVVEEYIAPVKTRRGWFSRRGPRYKYLTPSVRQAIDTARIRKGRWVNIVVHNSGTRQGSAKAFDYYHRKVRKMENGLAYHFVIGNGTSTGNGAIEIGSRWTRQINGGHVRSNRLNDISLGICFVGDFNRDLPSREQLESLQELITYLRKRLGKTKGKYARVESHKGINPTPTSCPGKRFPYKWFYQTFGKR